MRKTAGIFILFLWLPMLCFAKGDQDGTQAAFTEKLLEEYSAFYGDFFADGIERLDLEESLTAWAPSFDVRELLGELLAGKLQISLPQLLGMLLKYLLGEVYRSLRLMALVLATSVLCSYLTGLQTGFGQKGVTQAAYFACYLVIAGTASSAFYDTAVCVSRAIGNIAGFMEMVVPVVITTLVTSGALVSASVFEPFLLAIVEIAIKVIQCFFIPLVMMSAAMNLVGGISERYKIERLTKFMHQCAKWGLSIMMTVFVSTASLQSIAASGADGLSVKLSKFAAANLIPVVGGILSESVETVMNCSVLIKNSVGVLGILCLAAIAIAPLCKVAAILLIFRLTAAVAEPVSEPQIVQCLSKLANAVSILFSMLAAATVMLIIVLTIVIHAGNTAVLLGR